MSRQFQLYLLPDDIEHLISTLKPKLGVSLIAGTSERPIAVRIDSPMRKQGLMLKDGSIRSDCYIVPSQNADIRMRFYPQLSQWSVQMESEVIEFDGCEFDGQVLVRGRFYVQTDLMISGIIIPKQNEFLAWVDRVFRLAKKSLHRSNATNAYIGESAEKWRKQGGRFASTVTHVRGPIYEPEGDF